jgi:hypothetical protein
MFPSVNKSVKILSSMMISVMFLCGSLPPFDAFSPPRVEAATSTFNTSGSWQAPAGVTQVLVEAWGGGAAGGGRGSSNGQSGGGGGGAFASATITVVPLQNYSYTVAASVAGGNGNGTNGNNSVWDTGSEVLAAGGKGGLGTTTGGLGGLVADSVGTTRFKGGDGANASTTVSGGGGGGAGTTGAGGNATIGTAGTGTTVGGGAGGAGVTNANGNPGSTAGGGGSGARRTSSNRSGGAGAAGQIRITFNAAPVFTVNPSDSPDPVNYGSNVTFSATATDTEQTWKLVVCKTNSVTPGVNPTCAASQTVCVSASAVASGASNNCTWMTDQTTTLTWYAFACDSAASMPACSAANTANSPLTINIIISVAVTSDGTISFGTLGSGQARSTTAAELNDTQVAQNDTNIAEDFNIKTVAPAGWTLGPTAGPDTYVYEFSTNSGGAWTKFITSDAYQTLVTNIAPSATTNLDLRFTSPNPSSSSLQKNVSVTIQAVQH